MSRSIRVAQEKGAKMNFDRWSTHHIPARQRVEFWRGIAREALIPVTPHIPQPEAFQATLTTRSVGALVLNRVQVQTAHDVERLRADIERSGPPSLIVDLYLTGHAQVSLPGPTDAVRELLAHAGQPFLLDDRRTYRLAHDGPVSMLALVVPLALLDVNDDVLASLTARRLPPSASLQLLAQQMRLLAGWPHALPVAEAARLSDLVAGTLQAVVQTVDNVPGMAATREHGLITRRVRKLIARQYPDPALGPIEAAHQLGISVRTLQAHLAQEGTNFSTELMVYRLERAHALLHGGNLSTTTVMGVAERCGFSSPSHFSRRFSMHYGGPPSDLIGKDK